MGNVHFSHAVILVRKSMAGKRYIEVGQLHNFHVKISRVKIGAKIIFDDVAFNSGFI